MAGPFFYRSLATGTGTGLSWANARTSLATMTSVVAGDQIWVSDDHNEAPGANLTITFPGTAASPNIVICADRTKASPASGDWKTTGIVSTTGNFSVTIGGSAYIYGLTFTSGITSNTVNGLAVGQGGGSWQYFDTCVLRLATTSTSGSSRISLGATGNNVGNRVTLDNTQMNLSVVQQNIQPAQGHFVWRNTANPFPNAVPTNFMNFYSQPFTWTFECVDLLAMDAGRTLIAAGLTWYRVALYGCRLGGATVSPTITSQGSEVLVCHSGISTNPGRPSELTRYSFEGTEQTDVTICRVRGANDSTRAISRTFITNGNALPDRPFTGLPIAEWNNTTISSLTVTLYWIRNSSSGIPFNNQVWFEVQYFGDSGSSLMTIDHCGVKPNYVATSTRWTADTSDWTAGIVPARANSQSYTVGNSIKLASNPGRVFFCSIGGTSAASEPPEYAAALDNFSIEDGGAFFRAGTRFKTEITISSPQVALAGPIYIIPKIASMNTAVPILWLDPVIY